MKNTFYTDREAYRKEVMEFLGQHGLRHFVPRVLALAEQSSNRGYGGDCSDGVEETKDNYRIAVSGGGKNITIERVEILLAV